MDFSYASADEVQGWTAAQEAMAALCATRQPFDGQPRNAHGGVLTRLSAQHYERRAQLGRRELARRRKEAG